MTGYPDPASMLMLIAKSEFHPFTKADWYAWAGCESENPLICETENYAIVIDNNTINMLIYGDEYGGEIYKLNCLGLAKPE